jgi:hypothetical protein
MRLALATLALVGMLATLASSAPAPQADDVGIVERQERAPKSLRREDLPGALREQFDRLGSDDIRSKVRGAENMGFCDPD